MKNYFKKRRFVCTKTLTMDNGEVSFIKHKVYVCTWETVNHIGLIDEFKKEHTVTDDSFGSWKKHFIEIQPVES